MKLKNQIILLAVCTMAVASCSGPRPKQQKSTFFSSSSPKSPPRRAAEDRPKGYAEDKGPFEADRMLILGYAQRTAASHGESHGRQALDLDGYSHPACAGLPAEMKVRCPLSDVKWTVFKDLKGGIAMETTSPVKNPGLYRMRLLCHMAFATSQGKRAVCPLHVSGVRVTLSKVGKKTTLVILAGERRQKAMLKLVRALFD